MWGWGEPADPTGTATQSDQTKHGFIHLYLSRLFLSGQEMAGHGPVVFREALGLHSGVARFISQTKALQQPFKSSLCCDAFKHSSQAPKSAQGYFQALCVGKWTVRALRTSI